MPRDSNTMPICSPSKHECVEKAVGIVEQTAFDVTGRIWLNHICTPVRGVGTRNPWANGPQGMVVSQLDWLSQSYTDLFSFDDLFWIRKIQRATF